MTEQEIRERAEGLARGAICSFNGCDPDTAEPLCLECEELAGSIETQMLQVAKESAPSELAEQKAHIQKLQFKIEAMKKKEKAPHVGNCCPLVGNRGYEWLEGFWQLSGKWADFCQWCGAQLLPPGDSK